MATDAEGEGRRHGGTKRRSDGGTKARSDPGASRDSAPRRRDEATKGPAIETCPSNDAERFLLTDDHRMLLQIRDTLYEGSWEDFIRDLEARAAGRPHVFELVPASDNMKATIAGHLRMIQDMREWEAAQGRPLRSDERTPTGPS